MRPLRAFAVLGLLLGAWSNWRFQEARATYSAMLALPGRIAAERTPASQFRLPMQFVGLNEPVWSPAATRAVRPERAATMPPLASAVEVAGALAEPRRFENAPTIGHQAFSTAADAYRARADGNRRVAAKRFAAAIAEAPEHANAGAWTAELRQLRKRWSADAYMLLREGGGSVASNLQPLLGGGQSGARLSYAVDPLASRPVELFARFNIAQNWLDLDSSSAQAAIGATWQPFGRRGPTVSAERLAAVGNDGRDAWAARIAGGAVHTADARVPIDFDAYAEAGAIGLRRADLFAGGQVYALYPLIARDKLRVALGGGAWGSAQHSAAAKLSRIEFGPSARLVRRTGFGALELRADYRWRIAGNAAPGSGPAVTIVSRY